MIGVGRKQNFEGVRPVVPDRNADHVEVARKVGDFRLKISKCCRTGGGRKEKELRSNIQITDEMKMTTMQDRAPARTDLIGQATGCAI